MKTFLNVLMCLTLMLASYVFGRQQEKKATETKHSYKVGECLSNGLFIEQIRGIENDQYIMVGLIIKDDGTRYFTLPDKISEFVLNVNYVKMKCPKEMTP